MSTSSAQADPQVLIRGVRLYGEGEPVDVLIADGLRGAKPLAPE